MQMLSNPRVRYLVSEHAIPWIAVPAIMIVLAFTVFDRTPPVSGITGTVYPKGVEKTGVYCIHWRAERHRVCKRQATHEFVDSTGYSHKLVLAPPTGNAAIGTDRWSRCFNAPAAASWGMGQHRVSISYYCNPFHNWWPIIVEPDAVPVEIIPEPKAASN